MRGRLDVKNVLGMEDTKKNFLAEGCELRDGLGGERWNASVTDRGVTTKPKQTENEELNAKNQTVVHDSRKRQ